MLEQNSNTVPTYSWFDWIVSTKIVFYKLPGWLGSKFLRILGKSEDMSSVLSTNYSYTQYRYFVNMCLQKAYRTAVMNLFCEMLEPKIFVFSSGYTFVYNFGSGCSYVMLLKTVLHITVSVVLYCRYHTIRVRN